MPMIMLFNKLKHYEARKIHLSSTNFTKVLPLPVATFDDIKLRAFNYIWIKNITLKSGSHLPKKLVLFASTKAI